MGGHWRGSILAYVTSLAARIMISRLRWCGDVGGGGRLGGGGPRKESTACAPEH
jgi:hypothetical protein